MGQPQHGVAWEVHCSKKAAAAAAAAYAKRKRKCSTKVSVLDIVCHTMIQNDRIMDESMDLERGSSE